MAIRSKEYDSVLIIDDHKLLVDGLKLLIGHLFYDMHQTYDGQSGINQALLKKPQLIILDYNLPDLTGDLIMKELSYRLSDTKFIAYTFLVNPDIAQKMIHNGVDGFVLKNEDDEEIVKAIEYVMNGDQYYCKEVRNQLINRIGKQNEQKRHLIGSTDFSSKEIEIIELICKQKTAKEISKFVYLSERTVEQYRSNIIRKIGAQNIGGIIKFALQNGLIKIEDL